MFGVVAWFIEGLLGLVDELITLVFWFWPGVGKLAGHQEMIGPFFKALIDEFQPRVHLLQHYRKSKCLDMSGILLFWKH